MAGLRTDTADLGNRETTLVDVVEVTKDAVLAQLSSNRRDLLALRSTSKGLKDAVSASLDSLTLCVTSVADLDEAMHVGERFPSVRRLTVQLSLREAASVPAEPLLGAWLRGCTRLNELRLLGDFPASSPPCSALGWAEDVLVALAGVPNQLAALRLPAHVMRRPGGAPPFRGGDAALLPPGGGHLRFLTELDLQDASISLPVRPPLSQPSRCPSFNAVLQFNAYDVCVATFPETPHTHTHPPPP